MSKAALETLKNTLLGSGIPITAAGHHRPFEQAMIDDLYDAQTRGNVLKDLSAVLSLMTGDQVLLIRSGVAYLVDKDLLGTGGGGGPGVTDGDKGDIIVSAAGTVWTVKKDFVTSVVSTAGSTITLAFLSKERGFFSGNASFATPKTVALATETAATSFDFMFDVTNLAATVTFPGNFRSSHPQFILNVFTPLDVGLYKAHATKYGSLWLVDFNGVYSVGDAPPTPPTLGITADITSRTADTTIILADNG